MQDLAGRSYWGEARRNLAGYAAFLGALLAIVFLAAIVITPAKALEQSCKSFPDQIRTMHF